jgi:hypothetical protein
MGKSSFLNVLKPDLPNLEKQFREILVKIPGDFMKFRVTSADIKNNIPEIIM